MNGEDIKIIMDAIEQECGNDDAYWWYEGRIEEALEQLDVSLQTTKKS